SVWCPPNPASSRARPSASTIVHPYHPPGSAEAAARILADLGGQRGLIACRARQVAQVAVRCGATHEAVPRAWRKADGLREVGDGLLEVGPAGRGVAPPPEREHALAAAAQVAVAPG